MSTYRIFRRIQMIFIRTWQFPFPFCFVDIRPKINFCPSIGKSWWLEFNLVFIEISNGLIGIRWRRAPLIDETNFISKPKAACSLAYSRRKRIFYLGVPDYHYYYTLWGCWKRSALAKEWTRLEIELFRQLFMYSSGFLFINKFILIIMVIQ